MLAPAQTVGVFFLTALGEITGCFLPYLRLRKWAPYGMPAAASLTVFVWPLTRHPAANGRVYVAYGGLYVTTALLWLKFVDGARLSASDWIGACIALAGMLVIANGWRPEG